MEKYTIYITKHQTERGGEICAGDEDSSWPSHELEIIETKFLKAYTSPPADKMFYETVDVDQKTYDKIVKQKHLYLAVIFYTDGGTFGATSGYFELVGIETSSKKAEQLNKNRLSNNTIGYKPWEGYFASLDNDEVILLELESEKKDD